MSKVPLEPRSNGSPGERAFVLTVAALVLLTPPALTIFDAPVFILGIPLLHIYTFAVWLAAIALGGVLAARMGDRPQPSPEVPPRAADKVD